MKEVKQRKDGRYQKRIWDGTYFHGKKHYVSVYATEPGELRKAVTVRKSDSARRSHIFGPRMDLYDYALEWFKSAKSMSSIGTKTMYMNIINVHIAPYSIPLCNLSTRAVQNMINSAKDKPRTCQQIRLTLKQVLSYAEADRLIEPGRTMEIMSKLQLPKYRATEKEPLTDAETKAIFNADLSPKQRAFLLTLYYCGIRREEALILTVSDFSDGVLSINKAVCFDGNIPVVKSTKTERGNRTIPVPKPLQDALTEYLKDKCATDLMFPNQQGKVMTKSGYRRFWESIQHDLFLYDKNDYSSLTAHRFRHNYCTMLCYQASKKRNITTKKIAELLGDTEKMVLDVYSHVVEDKEDTENAIESAFSSVDDLTTN